ncbi:MAG: SpoIIE family protein phosphatase [Desulfohalobiaceae bacterium]|nr:SpoIIE family protein phosphatase [Desulfohalobiaceae bacterium]
MKIRSKFSLLAIFLVVVPLVTVTYFQHSSMTRFGTRMAEHTGDILARKERDLLHKIVQDYSAILRRDKMTHERALHFQAREVERLLGQKTAEPPRIYFPEAFRRGEDPLPGLRLDYKHMRQERSEERSPVWVNYEHQVIHLAPGASKAEVSETLSRISGLTQSYRFVYRLHPDHILWQQTVFASGVQSTYPAHGEALSNYDPRKETWYRRAKQTGSMVRVVSKNPASKTINQVVAMPIHFPDGRFAGATAISVPYERAFQDLRFATIWGASATAMLAAYQPDGSGGYKLQILARESQRDGGTREWDGQGRKRSHDTFDLEPFPKVRRMIASGDSGVHKIERHNREMLLAHGSHKRGEPFPLILLPYEEIVAQAEAEKQTIRSETSQWVLLSGFILLGAIGLSVLLALWSARSMTRPVLHLASAARRLAQGDFQTRIDLDSRDEMQELGDIFNDIGPKLEEHKRMSQAMEVAKKAQNYLLPRYAPKTPGFDICGTSIYSDETGGDYYDFIEIEHPESKHLAIAVGDVSGHGLGAAFLMSSARGIIRSHALQYHMDLQDLLQTLNSHLVHDSRDDQFLTLFYAVLDPETHSLTWISAGHEPALFYRARSGEVEDIPCSGMPLGVTAHVSHDRQQELNMEPGDILLIGTDGIREARNPSREMFGRERVQTILAENAEKTTDRICRAIVDSLQLFCSGRRQDDDITLVAIKYQPEDEAPTPPAPEEP